MHPRWYMPAVPADPCAVCGAERQPHACGITLTRPGGFALTVTDAGTFVTAFPLAFTRTVRDA
jgi:hypothetical protein